MYLCPAYGYRGLPVSVGNTDALCIKSKMYRFHALYKIKEQNKMRKYKFVHVLKLRINEEV